MHFLLYTLAIRSYPRPMYDLDIIEHTQTSIGEIYLGTREKIGSPGIVHEIQINGLLLMSSVSPVSERRLALSALEQHRGKDLRVLVGGLGLGYTAEAALSSDRVAFVKVAEKMEFVIDWMQRGLFPLSEKLAKEVESGRLEFAQTDIYEDVLGPAEEKYDLILIDVDHAPDDPLSLASRPFYTTEGQQMVSKHLKPGGILAVWSALDNEDFTEVMADSYAESHNEDVHWEDDERQQAPYHNVLFFGRISAI